MLSKKLKLTSLVLLAAPLFSYSGLSAAAKNNSSDFVVRIFNKTNLTQPLHYTVKNDGKDPVEGQLLPGDDNGKIITISGKSVDKESAEIIITDLSGRMIWDGEVTYYGTESVFYTDTIFLDWHYSIGSNASPSIHAISFDIRSQS